MSNVLTPRQEASSLSLKPSAYHLNPTSTSKRAPPSPTRSSSSSSPHSSRDTPHAQRIEEWRSHTSRAPSSFTSPPTLKGSVSTEWCSSAPLSPCGGAGEGESYDALPPPSPRSGVAWAYCPDRSGSDASAESGSESDSAREEVGGDDECEWACYPSYYLAASQDSDGSAAAPSVDSAYSRAASSAQLSCVDTQLGDVNVPGMQTFDELVGNLFLTHQGRAAAGQERG